VAVDLVGRTGSVDPARGAMDSAGLGDRVAVRVGLVGLVVTKAADRNGRRWSKQV
jgi:hypothetical protein